MLQKSRKAPFERTRPIGKSGFLLAIKCLAWFLPSVSYQSIVQSSLNKVHHLHLGVFTAIKQIGQDLKFQMTGKKIYPPSPEVGCEKRGLWKGGGRLRSGAKSGIRWIQLGHLSFVKLVRMETRFLGRKIIWGMSGMFEGLLNLMKSSILKCKGTVLWYFGGCLIPHFWNHEISCPKQFDNHQVSAWLFSEAGTVGLQ